MKKKKSLTIVNSDGSITDLKPVKKLIEKYIQMDDTQKEFVRNTLMSFQNESTLTDKKEKE